MALPPDFLWTALYYPSIIAALLELKAEHWPEHTEEDPHDPAIQLLRAYAVLAHQQACRIDHTARELFPETAQLRGSMIPHGRLWDRPLQPAVPAEAEVLADISGALSGATTVLRGYALLATEGDADSPAIVFEYPTATDLSVGPTGSSSFLVLEDDGVAPIAIPSYPHTLWAISIATGDAVYWGHPTLMFDRIGLTWDSLGSGLTHVRWEYFDDLRAGAPDSLTVLGGTQIRFDISGVIGSSRGSGLQVTVTCLRTGVSQTVTSDWNSPYNVATTGYLGQSVPSTSLSDYRVECDWIELPDRAGGLSALNETLSWSLPQGSNRRWAKTTVGGVEGYFIRLRMVLATTPTAPVLAAVSEARRTSWSVLFDVQQGRRVTERFIGDGTASQRLTLSRGPVLSLEEVTVDGAAWSEQEDLLTSTSAAQHFTFREQPDESWQLRFGDGTNGAIPGAAAITATYRIGGGESGNVGALAISQLRSGGSRLRNPRNPRPATGWVAAEGSTAASLELLRDALPASLRTRGRAVTPEDCETLALDFMTADGSQVAVRALAIEEANGLKTVGLTCVGPGGIAPATADLAELGEYFNGETVGLQRVGGVLVSNQELTAQAFTPRTVDITATVSVLSAYSAVAEDLITAALGERISPIAKRLVLQADGTYALGEEWLWEWESTVSRALLTSIIALAASGITNITLSAPAADITLAAGELPVLGTVSLTITPV